MTIALASQVRQGDEFVNMLLQDPDGQIDALIEKYHTRELSQLCCQNAAVNARRGNGLLIHNYAPLPAPKINQLVIPTGATRWSYCLLLANDEIKKKAYTAAEDGKNPLNLIFGTKVGTSEEAQNTIVLSVYLLQPIRITPTSIAAPDGPTETLWVIPVVDERYWWQFTHTGAISETISDERAAIVDADPDATLMPDDLNEIIQTEVGAEIFNVKVNVNHKLIPTCAESNDYENMPMYMDSIYAHFGQRLVVDIGCWAGDHYVPPQTTAQPESSTRFVLIDGFNSKDVIANNHNGFLGIQECTWNLDGEDTLYSAADQIIQVGKPNVVAGGKSYTSQYNGPTVNAPFSVEIQTTEGTYVTRGPDAELYKTPTTEFDAIWRTQFDEEPEAEQKDQIGRDYFYQFAYQFDYTFAGVQPWQQGYFDDYMVLRQSFNTATGAYDAYTRVCSRQPNLTGEWTGKNTTGPYWAVNIGSLATPELSVQDGVLSGKTTGIAGLFSRDADDNLRITTGRKSFERWDDGGVIEDGTLIQLDLINGKTTIVFANCEPTEGLTGLDPAP